MKTILLTMTCAWGLMAAPASDAVAVKEVTAAMESLKQAMLHKDGAALDKLLSEDLTYIHSAGQNETKAEFMKAIVSGKSIVERLDLTGTAVRYPARIGPGCHVSGPPAGRSRHQTSADDRLMR